MSQIFTREFDVIWADLDPNGHMRHTAYMDYAAQVRLAFLTEHGFTLAKFQQARVGPILFREETDYRREVRAGERITVGLELIGLSANRKHWAFRQPIYKASGELAATVTVRGAWFSLTERKVVPAPEALEAVVEKMPHAADFAPIEKPV